MNSEVSRLRASGIEKRWVLCQMKRWVVILFCVSLSLLLLSVPFLLLLKKKATVSWDNRSNKCWPDVCHGSNIMEIAGYNKQMPIALVNSTVLYDTAMARKCFQNKYTVILGDSSLTETVHDIIYLLTRLAVNDDILSKYMKNCIGHRDKVFNNYEFKIPHDSTATIQLDRDTGHRNLTYTLPDYNIYIRHRYTGGNTLYCSFDGVPGMLMANVIDEYRCLLGDPATACRKPDIVIIKSGHHDIKHYNETVEALPKLMSLLCQAKRRGTKVYWLSTTDLVDTPVLEDLNSAAKRYCTEYNIPYIDTNTPAHHFKHIFQGQPLTTLLFKESTAHIGPIRFDDLKRKDMLLLSSYMTQYILRHIC